AATRFDTAARFERGEHAVEPAGVRVARPCEPALQHVLAIEMRALAIRRCGSMDDDRMTLAVKPMQVRHRRVEREEAVERKSWRLTLWRKGCGATQLDPIRIACRCDDGQAVESAAQDDR